MRARRPHRAGHPVEVLTFPGWRELRRRLPRLLLGIVGLGFGIAMMVRARLGLSPWDVLHQGIAGQTGIAFGTVLIGVGVVVLLFWIPLRQRLGLGTLLNTAFVGVAVEIALAVIDEPHERASRVALLAGGLLVIAVGTGLYIGAGLGPGPRDGLMTGIAARGVSIWVVRMVLELAVLVTGWALGGDVGVGTVVFAFGIGPLVHVFLAWFRVAAAGAELGPGLAAE